MNADEIIEISDVEETTVKDEETQSSSGVESEGTVDQLNLDVYFWYLVKIDMSSVYVYISVHWTTQFIQDTRKSWLFGRVVGLKTSFKILQLNRKQTRENCIRYPAK